MRTQVWSSGGGTQSAAIAVLICQGVLKPDISVIIDTEREVSQTWEYHENVVKPALLKVGVEMHRVPKSKYATVDLYGGKDKDTLLIPAFTRSGPEEKEGKMPTFCSNEWKARVVKRFCTHLMPESKGFDLWLGISKNESHRMKTGEGKWEYKHPLIDDGRLMTRIDCLELVKAYGWPEPPRSRCWMCPNQGHDEWEDLIQKWPKDYLKAKVFEKEIQQIDPDVYLRGQGGAKGDCMSGMCFV